MPNVFSSVKEKDKTNEYNDERFSSDVETGSDPETNKLKAGSGNKITSAFCYYPENVRFVNEDAEEKIILLLRRHQITNLKWIATAILLVVLPGFISVLPFFDFLPFRYQVVIWLIWYLAVSAFIFEKFLTWFFHVNIVTDERIIEVDFVSLIYREMTDANIDQIQDVTVQVGGALRTSINFGDVAIQTAGEIPKITFESVPNPDLVAKVLRELRVEEEKEKLEGRVR